MKYKFLFEIPELYEEFIDLNYEAWNYYYKFYNVSKNKINNCFLKYKYSFINKKYKNFILVLLDDNNNLIGFIGTDNIADTNSNWMNELYSNNSDNSDNSDNNNSDSSDTSDNSNNNTSDNSDDSDIEYWIRDLFIKKEYRNNGYSSILCNKFFNICRIANINTLLFTCDSEILKETYLRHNCIIVDTYNENNLIHYIMRRTLLDT